MLDFSKFKKNKALADEIDNSVELEAKPEEKPVITGHDIEFGTVLKKLAEGIGEAAPITKLASMEPTLDVAANKPGLVESLTDVFKPVAPENVTNLKPEISIENIKKALQATPDLANVVGETASSTIRDIAKFGLEIPAPVEIATALGVPAAANVVGRIPIGRATLKDLATIAGQQMSKEFGTMTKEGLKPFEDAIKGVVPPELRAKFSQYMGSYIEDQAKPVTRTEAVKEFSKEVSKIENFGVSLDKADDATQKHIATQLADENLIKTKADAVRLAQDFVGKEQAARSAGFVRPASTTPEGVVQDATREFIEQPSLYKQLKDVNMQIAAAKRIGKPVTELTKQKYDLLDKIGQRKPVKVEDLLKLPPDKKITITNKQGLKSQLKFEARAAKQAAREAYQTARLHTMIKRFPKGQITVAERKEIKVLMDLYKKYGKTATKDELKMLYQRLSQLQKLGHANYLYLKEAKQQMFEVTKEAMLAELNNTGFNNPVKIEQLKKSFVKSALTKFNLATRNVQRIVNDMMGGDFEGVWYDNFINKPTQNFSNYLLKEGERYDSIVSLYKAHKYASRTMTDKISEQGLELERREVMYAWASRNNDEQMKAIVYRNEIPLQKLLKMFDKLTPEDKAVADGLADIVGERLQELNETRLLLTNGAEELVPVRGKYLPIWGDSAYAKSTDVIDEDFINRKFFNKYHVSDTMVHTRKQITEEGAKKLSPISMKLDEVATDAITKQEYYINMAPMIQELQKYVVDPELTGTMRAKFGQDTVAYMQRYVSNQLANTNPQVFSLMSKLYTTMRTNAAAAYMTYNASVALRQLTTYPLFLTEVGAGSLKKATFQYLTNKEYWDDFIYSVAGELKYRDFEGEMKNLMRTNPSQYAEFNHKIQTTGLHALKFFDQSVANIGWIAKYQEGMLEHGVEDQAVTEATNTVTRIAGSAYKKNMSEILLDPHLKLLNMFQNYPNTVWNIISYDVPHRFKIGKHEKAWRGVLGVALSFTADYWMDNKELPTSFSDFSKLTLGKTMENIPLAGQFIRSFISGSTDRTPPVFGAMKASFEAIKALSNDKYGEAVLQTLAALGYGTGSIPSSQLSKMARVYGLHHNPKLKKQESHIYDYVLGAPKKTYIASKAESEIKAKRAKQKGQHIKAALLSMGVDMK